MHWGDRPACTSSCQRCTRASHFPRTSNCSKGPYELFIGIEQLVWLCDYWKWVYITGDWVIPTVQATRKATYSSSWIGIDGFNNSSLIQTGTEQDYYGGSAHYQAWWEILPAAETVITGMTIHPGDHMHASIQNLGGGTWSITLQDVTTGNSFTTQQLYIQAHKHPLSGSKKPQRSMVESQSSRTMERRHLIPVQSMVVILT